MDRSWSGRVSSSMRSSPGRVVSELKFRSFFLSAAWELVRRKVPRIGMMYPILLLGSFALFWKIRRHEKRGDVVEAIANGA